MGTNLLWDISRTPVDGEAIERLFSQLDVEDLSDKELQNMAVWIDPVMASKNLCGRRGVLAATFLAAAEKKDRAVAVEKVALACVRAVSQNNGEPDLATAAAHLLSRIVRNMPTMHEKVVPTVPFLLNVVEGGWDECGEAFCKTASTILHAIGRVVYGQASDHREVLTRNGSLARLVRLQRGDRRKRPWGAWMVALSNFFYDNVAVSSALDMPTLVDLYQFMASGVHNVAVKTEMASKYMFKVLTNISYTSGFWSELIATKRTVLADAAELMNQVDDANVHAAVKPWASLCLRITRELPKFAPETETNTSRAAATIFDVGMKTCQRARTMDSLDILACLELFHEATDDAPQSAAAAAPSLVRLVQNVVLSDGDELADLLSGRDLNLEVGFTLRAWLVDVDAATAKVDQPTQLAFELFWNGSEDEILKEAPLDLLNFSLAAGLRLSPLLASLHDDWDPPSLWRHLQMLEWTDVPVYLLEKMQNNGAGLEDVLRDTWVKDVRGWVEIGVFANELDAYRDRVLRWHMSGGQRADWSLRFASDNDVLEDVVDGEYAPGDWGGVNNDLNLDFSTESVNRAGLTISNSNQQKGFDHGKWVNRIQNDVDKLLEKAGKDKMVWLHGTDLAGASQIAHRIRPEARRTDFGSNVATFYLHPSDQVDMAVDWSERLAPSERPFNTAIVLFVVDAFAFDREFAGPSTDWVRLVCTMRSKSNLDDPDMDLIEEVNNESSIYGPILFPVHDATMPLADAISLVEDERRFMRRNGQHPALMQLGIHKPLFRTFQNGIARFNIYR